MVKLLLIVFDSVKLMLRIRFKSNLVRLLFTCLSAYEWEKLQNKPCTKVWIKYLVQLEKRRYSTY